MFKNTENSFAFVQPITTVQKLILKLSVKSFSDFSVENAWNFIRRWRPKVFLHPILLNVGVILDFQTEIFNVFFTISLLMLNTIAISLIGKTFYL